MRKRINGKATVTKISSQSLHLLGEGLKVLDTMHPRALDEKKIAGISKKL